MFLLLSSVGWSSYSFFLYSAGIDIRSQRNKRETREERKKKNPPRHSLGAASSITFAAFPPSWFSILYKNTKRKEHGKSTRRCSSEFFHFGSFFISSFLVSIERVEEEENPWVSSLPSTMSSTTVEECREAKPTFLFLFKSTGLLCIPPTITNKFQLLLLLLLLLLLSFRSASPFFPPSSFLYSDVQVEGWWPRFDGY